MNQQSWKRELERKNADDETAGTEKPRKSRAKAKAKAKGKAKAKSRSAKAKASPKKAKSPKVTKTRSSRKRPIPDHSEVTPPEVSDVVTEPVPKRKTKKDQRTTFARRYKPKTPWGAAQWDALLAAFVGIIAVQVSPPHSKLEARCLKKTKRINRKRVDS